MIPPITLSHCANYFIYANKIIIGLRAMRLMLRWARHDLTPFLILNGCEYEVGLTLVLKMWPNSLKNLILDSYVVF